MSSRSHHASLLLSAVLLAACAGPPAPPALPDPAPVVPAANASASAPPPRSSARRTDPRWLLAAGDDPLEKARLAVAVGAAELLEGVADGGEIAEIALLSLPFADDGEIALGPLSALLSLPSPPRASVLAAILGVAGTPRRSREARDPEGAKRCAEVLLALVVDASRPREERALALSAARALGEKGYVDRARIPDEIAP